MAGPCSQIIGPDDVEACCESDQFDEHDPPSDALLEQAAAAASFVAWALAGRRHGTCTVVGERPSMPTKRRCCRDYRWGSCSCREPSVVALRFAPVQTIDAVYIGGVALDPADYVLVAPNRLVRRDGQRWPDCQRLGEPDTADDVLTVDYTWGVPVDVMGVRAIGKLGCELVKACLDRACRLPERVTAVTRQGISLAVLDPMDFLSDGRTGVYELDLWLAAVNPGALRARSRVRTPDIAPAVTPIVQGT